MQKSLLSPPDSCPVLIASAKHKPSSWIHTITSCSELLSMFWWDIVILKQHLDRIKSRTNSLYVQFTTSVCLNTEMCPLVLVLFHTLLGIIMTISSLAWLHALWKWLCIFFCKKQRLQIYTHEQNAMQNCTFLKLQYIPRQNLNKYYF